MASITANDGRHADAALVQRFRQAHTQRERTAVMADVVHQQAGAVLRFCAERLWPDADAALLAASDVLVAARLGMPDPAKSPRPGRLHGWLLGIAAQVCLLPRLPAPALIDAINWDAVRAADVPETHDSPARLASLRHWLEQIVATLPEPRQRMHQLFVVRGLDSRSAAAELGTTVAEVRRLRRENRQAILRAFEVTALADADLALDRLGGGATGCRELRDLLADAHYDGGRHSDSRRHTVVLPTAARLTLSRHLSECGTCQDRRDDCMARWAPELLPVLTDVELFEQVMDDLQTMPQGRRPVRAPSAGRRLASAGTMAAVGSGLLAVLLLLALVWPGFLHGTGGAAAVSSQNLNSGTASGLGAPQADSSSVGVSVDNNQRPDRPGASGVLSSHPPVATANSAEPSSASVPSSVYYTVPPSASPTPSPTRQASGPTPTSATTPSSSPATPQPVKTSPTTTSPTTTSPTPEPDPSTTAPSTPSPSPTVSTTPTPSPTVSTTSPTPSPAESTPAPTDSASTPAPTPTPSTSATS